MPKDLPNHPTHTSKNLKICFRKSGIVLESETKKTNRPHKPSKSRTLKSTLCGIIIANRKSPQQTIGRWKGTYMKALGTLLVSFAIFGSSIAMANHHISRVCLTPAVENPELFISAEQLIDEDTGLSSALLVSTTYTQLKFCKAALKRKLNSPAQPIVLQDVSVSLKCYKNASSDYVYFLVSESINLDTGLVSKLEIKNEFTNLESCQDWVK